MAQDPALTGRLRAIIKELIRFAAVINSRLIDRGQITIHFRGDDVKIWLNDVALEERLEGSRKNQN